ncbi:sensor histidine kinase [Streptomonospora litoralis]|uniref:sensor histidine kinase n=1 Tax=Streptomonospora litoralis TaxID=2498135 RepID=UPI001F607F8E|nr:nitrate- and nitrite sensing domain-containing protein [Streptomonospora litoralis]
MLLPSAAFIALWLAISGYLSYEAVEAAGHAEAATELSTPAALSLTAVMDERSQTVAYLERPDETRDELDAARQESDEHIQKVFDRFAPFRDLASPEIQDRIAEFEARYRGIDDIRAEVDEGTASRDEVLQDYNRVMTAAADLFDEQSRGSPEPGSIGAGVAATDTFRVVDLLARSDAQLTRSFTNGRLTHADQQEFTRLSSSYHTVLESVRGFFSPEQGRALDELMNSQDYQRLVQLENRIVDHEAEILMDPVTGEHSLDTGVPVSREEWKAAYAPVKEELTRLGAAEARHAASIQADTANTALIAAAVGTAGVALVGFLAISAALRTTHRVVRRLGRLRDETDHRANTLLPELADRLQRNEPVDAAAAVPPLTTGQDEIGEVAASFDKAQRFALDAAVRQSELLHGINRVFLNIAHRSQTLIHRQLRLLDRMEREQEDPSQLTELFKLDHLATRSRRNAENLLILGGETPGRTFHKPMPLVDVLRGAISESGDYTRVERRQIPRVALKGPAVADVIHLVAELVDNATTFSPPQSQVRLSSEQVPNGVVVEIEDRGLGMQDEEFAAANEMLANPPEFDVMRLNEKMRLGLFVVSRLARRHAVNVRLRSSPYGGVQAIVLLPSELISDQELPASAFDSTGERPQVVAPAPLRAEAATDAAPSAPKDRSDGDAGAAPDTDEPGTPAPAPAPAGANGHSPDSGRTPSGLPRRGSAPAPISSADDAAETGTDGADSAGAFPDGSAPNGAAPADASGTDGGGPTMHHPSPEPAPVHETAGAPTTAASAPPLSPEGGDGGADPDAFAQGTAAAAGTDARPPLPKRRPQTNLAPQLYEKSADSSAPAFGGAEDSSTEESEDRSARLRHNMSAFQQGTRRGRNEGQQRQNDTEKDS